MGLFIATHARNDTEVDNWAGELRLQGSFDAFGREHQVLTGIETNNRDRRLDHGGGV